ncbi:MAG: Flp family type IVb pilin [Alphaproteobacteria bacterium]
MLKPYKAFFESRRSLINEIEGASAIEYGLIAAGIAVAIIAVVFILGEDISVLFSNISEQVASKSVK